VTSAKAQIEITDRQMRMLILTKRHHTSHSLSLCGLA
jgi:hypothetical protein